MMGRKFVRGLAVATGGAAVLALLTTTPGNASAMRDPVTRPADTSAAFPTFVHLPADQAAHPSSAFEWWYVVGHLTGGGHRFGYEITLTFSGGVPETHIAITDQTTGRYYQHVAAFRPSQASASTTGLNVRMPTGRLSGRIDDMTLAGSLPAGGLSLHLRDTGPTLYPGGTGLIPFLGGTTYYYSLPNLATRGTLTLNGKTFAVSGQSWLDRQWGTWDWTKLGKWTWMAIQLRNGANLNMFDMFDTTGETHYATVAYPDGTQQVVSVTPLSAGSSGFWRSPVTGQRYATSWVLRIPHLHAVLRVNASPAGQEVLANYPGVTPSMFEGAASVNGRWQGENVSGAAYVEQLGHWQ